MIKFLIASMICSGIAKGLAKVEPVSSAVFGIPAIIFGLWFVYEFGSLVIMCLDKYAGIQ